jgi:hypothetical protein
MNDQEEELMSIDSEPELTLEVGEAVLSSWTTTSIRKTH